jgi:hypothetical protein
LPLSSQVSNASAPVTCKVTANDTDLFIGASFI